MRGVTRSSDDANGHSPETGVGGDNEPLLLRHDGDRELGDQCPKNHQGMSPRRHHNYDGEHEPGRPSSSALSLNDGSENACLDGDCSISEDTTTIAGDNEQLLARRAADVYLSRAHARAAGDTRGAWEEDEEDGNEEEGEGRYESGNVSAFVWLLTLAAGLSGVIFGFDTGIISSTLVSIRTDLSSNVPATPLTTLDKSLITSCTSLFALIASPPVGMMCDAMGRRKALFVADLLFAVGAIWQACAQSVAGLIVGRSVVGLALGGASFVGPLYISELSPSSSRGRLVTVTTLLITAGQTVAYVVGWLFSTQQSGWRWMVGLGAVPALLQFLVLLFLPETPRWLVKADRKAEAKQILLKVYSSRRSQQGEQVALRVLQHIEREVVNEETAVAGRQSRDSKRGILAKLVGRSDVFAELFSVGGNRRALTIACMLQGFQQLCGFVGDVLILCNSLMYYSATIFALVGFQSPILTSLCIAVTNLACTLFAYETIDRVGRRRILLYSIPVMVVGMILCAGAFEFVDLNSRQSTTSTSIADNFLPLMIVISTIVYVAGYAVGLGCVPWQQAELFPLSVRAVGSALATTTNWGSNFLVGLTFLPLMNALSPTGIFALYAGVCAAAWVCVNRFYPETAGLGLEEVGSLLRDGWGVT